MARHDFQDPVSGDMLELVVDETLLGEHGVEHPGCSDLATVHPHLDAFYCACGRTGRIDGAWVVELWRAAATYPGGA